MGRGLWCLVLTLDTKGGGGKGHHHACLQRAGLHGIYDFRGVFCLAPQEDFTLAYLGLL